MAKGKLPNIWSSASTHAQPPPSVADAPASVTKPSAKESRMSEKNALADMGTEKAIMELTKVMMTKDKNMMESINKDMGGDGKKENVFIIDAQKKYFKELAEIEIKAAAGRKKGWEEGRDKIREEELKAIRIKSGMSKEGAAFAAKKDLANEKSEKKKATGLSKMFHGMKDAFKKSPEELKEEKGRMARMFGGIKGLFGKEKSDADKGGGLLGGLKKMMSGYSKLIMGLLGAGLLAALSTLNMKQLKKVWEGIKGAFVAVYEFLKPIVVTIWDWAKSDLLPGLVTFFTDQIESITKMFSSLKERFEGWGEMSFGERVMSVLGAIGDIGIYIWDTFKNLMKLVGGLLGIDGTFFKDTWAAIKALPDTIMEKFSKLGDAVSNKWNQWFPDGVGGMLVDKVFTPLKEWFNNTFSFGSWKETLQSFVTLYFLPAQIIKDVLINPAAEWLGKKFGFDSSKFTDFSIGELFGKAMDEIVAWFDKLFNIDIKAIFGSILGKAGEIGAKVWGFFKGDKKEEPVTKTPVPKTPAEITREAEEEKETGKQSKTDYFRQFGEGSRMKGVKALGGKDAANEMWQKYKTGRAGPKALDRATASKSELEQIQKDEGFESGVYKDTMGIKTIGYGFNLERAGAQEALDAAGIKKSLADLSSGDVTMTEEEASRLMLGEMPHFKKVAERFVGKETWKNLSGNRQGIITNMAYNMGEGTLNKFKKLKAAIRSGDWQEAQVQMKDSSWSKQVKGRSDRLIARMGQNDTGTQLASAQSTSDSLGSSGGGGVIIAPNNVTNSTTNSSPMYAHETTHRDTEMLNNTAILDA
jgi:GH24 family phage-related lysozyme (muramidase)